MFYHLFVEVELYLNNFMGTEFTSAEICWLGTMDSLTQTASLQWLPMVKPLRGEM
jgi:hypothetical protein